MLNSGCQWLRYRETDLEVVSDIRSICKCREKKNVARQAQVTGLRNPHKHALLTTAHGVHGDGAERKRDRNRREERMQIKHAQEHDTTLMQASGPIQIKGSPV